MNQLELLESLGRPALWISRMRKRFGFQLLKGLGFWRGAVSLLACSSSLQPYSRSLPRIQTSKPLETECLRGSSKPALLSGKRLVGTRLSHSSTARSPRSYRSEDVWSGTTGRQMEEDALRLLREYRKLLKEIMETLARESKVLKGSLSWEKSVRLSSPSPYMKEVGNIKGQTL